MTEFSQLYPIEILETFLNGSLHNPDFNISSLLPSGIAYKDPKFFDDSGSNITSSLQVSYHAIWGLCIGWHCLSHMPGDHLHGKLLMPMQAARHDTFKPTQSLSVCKSSNPQSMPSLCASGWQVTALSGSHLQGLTVASSFVNYRPCSLAASPNGINIGPTGVLIQPVGILIQPKGVNVQPRGINFQPSVSTCLQLCLLEDQAAIIII